MIPRHLRIIYWSLLGVIVALAILLVVSRTRDHERMIAMRDQSPIPAPSDVPSEDISLAMPNDAEGTLAIDHKSLILPQSGPLRAKALLDRLLDGLASPQSPHPVPAGPAVTDVFFVPLPLRNPAASVTDQPSLFNGPTGVELAVVNLSKDFADNHPSGIETEDLTLRAIVGTLHANFPELSEVRFLVDGHPRDTLNGHADLSRDYAVSDGTHSIHPALNE